MRRDTGGEQGGVLAGKPEHRTACVEQNRYDIAQNASQTLCVGVDGNPDGADQVEREEGRQVAQDCRDDVEIKGLEGEGPEAEVNLEEQIHQEQNRVSDRNSQQGGAERRENCRWSEGQAIIPQFQPGFGFEPDIVQLRVYFFKDNWSPR